jgi:hypothetical protein
MVSTASKTARGNWLDPGSTPGGSTKGTTSKRSTGAGGALFHVLKNIGERGKTMTETTERGGVARPAMPDIKPREMAWMKQARCAGHEDPELWYRSVDYYGDQYDHLPNAKARETARRKDRDRAKALCRACPVIAECRAFIFAYETPGQDRHGIWGGMTPADRTKAAKAATKGEEIAA